MTDTAIRTENLTRDFNGLRAVDSLCLEVPRGTIFGFIGPNGAGKTTTIRLLLGLLEPSAGKAEVLGLDNMSQGHLVRAQCGALLENPGLYERLSAEENLEFYGRIYRLSKADCLERTEELLSHLGLWERRREKVGAWSRGMKQKLAVARVLIHRPPLVFLDEPTAGLDPVAAAALRRDLDALVAYEGVTVFLTTHNLAEAEKLCDRVGVINRGKLIAEGPPNELRAGSPGTAVEVRGEGFTGEIIKSLETRPEISDIELQSGVLCIRLRAEARMAPLVRLLVNSGAEVEEVRKTQASLEEVFLKLIEEEEK
ncbi:MAG TPA: ABC transporter ATP-binding protein [archaeon]|nr:ABC transporter ATP-binding protein [archaeon]